MNVTFTLNVDVPQNASGITTYEAVLASMRDACERLGLRPEDATFINVMNGYSTGTINVVLSAPLPEKKA